MTNCIFRGNTFENSIRQEIADTIFLLEQNEIIKPLSETRHNGIENIILTSCKTVYDVYKVDTKKASDMVVEKISNIINKYIINRQ